MVARASDVNVSVSQIFMKRQQSQVESEALAYHE